MVSVVLRDLDLHFQGKTFSCYAFVIKKHCAGRFALFAWSLSGVALVFFLLVCISKSCKFHRTFRKILIY